MATTKGMTMVCTLLVLLASTTGSFAIGIEESRFVLPTPLIEVKYVNSLNSSVTATFTSEPGKSTAIDIPALSIGTTKVGLLVAETSPVFVFTVRGTVNVTYSTAKLDGTLLGRVLSASGVQVTIGPATCPASDGTLGLLIGLLPNPSGFTVIPVESKFCLSKESK